MSLSLAVPWLLCLAKLDLYGRSRMQGGGGGNGPQGLELHSEMSCIHDISLYGL